MVWMQRPTLCTTAALSFALGLSGCANDRQRTIGQGVGAGAAIGAIVGGAIGGRDGAAAGAVVGAAAGGAYGMSVADQKKALADSEARQRAAIEQSRQEIAAAQAESERASRTLASLQQTEQRLRTAQLSARERSQTLAQGQQLARQSIRQVDDRLVALRGQIARQNQVLEQERQQLAALHRARPAEQSEAAKANESLLLVSSNIREMSQLERALLESKARLGQIDLRRAY